MNPQSYQPSLTPRFVSEALGLGSAQAASQTGVTVRPSEPFSAVTTDSRKISQGSLFVAIPGEKFDGHQFIGKAIEQGARGILCRRGTEVQARQGLFVFQVDDTIEGFRRLASAWRREFSIPVIAVAGSVGKTTTKEILAACLRGKWPEVLKTQGSQNGFVGIPMTLLELGPSHGAAVVEVGIDEIGAMEKHMEIVAASAAVLTAIGPEHLEKLRDVPTVAREEGIALSAVGATGGWVAVNLDDPWIRPHFSTLRAARKIGYSLVPDLAAPPPAGEVIRGQLNPEGARLTLQGPEIDGVTLALPLPGAHNARNLLAAIAVARGLGLTVAEIKRGLATFQPAGGRSELRELPGRIHVVCDYYNANPTSTEAGLELLTQSSHGTRGSTHPRWACLADMLELGSEEERFHRELAGPIQELGIEHVLLYGPRMKALHEELQTRGFKGGLEYFASHAELASALSAGVRAGDAVLIKGSRGMKMEEVWKLFQAAMESRRDGATSEDPRADA